MRPETETRLVVVGSLVALVLCHLWLAAHLGLAADEAYYWVWGLHPATGYLDHPPAIAWLIRASTALLGDSTLGVRALPLLLSALGLLPAIALAHDRGLAAFALAGLPLVWLGGFLATPDLPLVAFWSLGLWAAARERWLLLGLAAGLAMLSKYTGVLLLPLVLLADPRAGLRRGFWLAVATAFVVYLPNALWNVQHELLSWRFQLGHVAGVGPTAGAGSLPFLGAQALLVGPLLFLVILAWGGRHLRLALDFGDPQGRIDRLCWWTSMPVLAIAVLAGGEANWAAPAWVGAVVGLARMGGRWSRLAWAGAGISMALSLVGTAHAIHPIFHLDGDPLHRLEGGPILGSAVAAWGISPVFTARYQEAALIQFYGHVPAHALPEHGRPDQYDLWTPPPIPRNPRDERYELLYVRPWRADARLALDDLGWQRYGPNVVTAYAGTPDPLVSVPVQRWQVYDCWREDVPGSLAAEDPSPGSVAP